MGFPHGNARAFMQEAWLAGFLKAQKKKKLQQMTHYNYTTDKLLLFLDKMLAKGQIV